MSKKKPAAIVIGTGFGCRVHVPALRAAGFEVIALVGTDPDRTARRAERSAVPHSFTDLDAALALEGVDVVSVSSPPHLHAEHSMAATRAGKHVVCEKPFAIDLEEARAMLAAAEAAGVEHRIGHEFRWATERAITARAISDGLIGEPRFVTLVQSMPLVADPEARVPSWWLDPEKGGGWLGASGSHVIDQIRVWLGEFESVSAALTKVSARPSDVEDSFSIRFRLQNGVEGIFQETAAAWGPYASFTRVVGTDGTLWTEGSKVWLADRSGVRELPVPQDLMLPPPPQASDDPRHRFTQLELGPYTRLYEGLRAAMENTAVESPVPQPTFADGVAGMEVLQAIRASAAADGKLVTL